MLTTTPWSYGLGALLAGLAACGPAPSDQAANPEPRASVSRPSESPPVSQQSPSPRTDPITPAASPVPIASNPASPSTAQKDEPAPLPEQLVLPQWIAQALEAPDVRVRLRALDQWAQQGPEAPMDPLVVALDDKDDDVRAKAMALIERQWAVAPEAKPEGGEGREARGEGGRGDTGAEGRHETSGVTPDDAGASRESVGASTTNHQGGAACYEAAGADGSVESEPWC